MNVMPLPTRPSRPPVPTLIAFALFALLPLRTVWDMVVALLDGEWWGLILVPIIAIFAVILRGLWQGSRGAYNIVVVIAILRILSALNDTFDDDAPGDAASQLAANWTSFLWVIPPVAVLWLLAVAPSSRAFFARR